MVVSDIESACAHRIWFAFFAFCLIGPLVALYANFSSKWIPIVLVDRGQVLLQLTSTEAGGVRHEIAIDAVGALGELPYNQKGEANDNIVSGRQVSQMSTFPKKSLSQKDGDHLLTNAPIFRSESATTQVRMHELNQATADLHTSLNSSHFIASSWEGNSWSEREESLSTVGTACQSDGDCCGEVHSCNAFCELNGTISEKNPISGWRLGGLCKTRWDLFCRQDEDCSSGELCDRNVSTLAAGRCERDVRCKSVDCRNGRCTGGVCFCDMGYHGDNCELSDNAFAFLFYGSSTRTLLQARVLVHSIRRHSNDIHIYALVPTNFASITAASATDALIEQGVTILPCPPINLPPVLQADPIIRSRWSGVMDKFHAWSLDKHFKVAIIDSDIVFDPAGHPAHKVFDECSSDLCAVQDGDPRFMNAGLMVLRPSPVRLDHILRTLKQERHHYDMPEQSFLTEYVQDANNQMSFAYLDKQWNSCSSGGMMLNTGQSFTGFTAIHACSWGNKFADFKFTFQNPNDTSHAVLVWQETLLEMDPCFRIQSSTPCQGACHWCSHYCMSSTIECDSSLFKVAAPGTEVFESDMGDSRTKACNLTNDIVLPKKTEPFGSWMWPSVGIYQILIDRFASHDQTPCSDLKDYCGGQLSAANELLGYIAELGVDGLVLSPTAENFPKGYHGYWPKNLGKVNEHFGTDADLKQFIVNAHARRMRVVADLNLNHAGEPWLKGSFANFSELSPFNESKHYHTANCSLWTKEDFQNNDLRSCSLFGMADYNHENDEVWRGLMDFVRDHIDRYGFDGIRIDAARHIPQDFLSQLPDVGPPVPAYYEVPDSDRAEVARYSSQYSSAIYNYPLYYAMRECFVSSSVQRTVPPRAMSHLATFLNAEADNVHLNFLDNNDEPRFIRMLLSVKDRRSAMLLYRNALSLLMMMPGVPILLYGSEQNAMGRIQFADVRTELAHNWRPALWETGYSTDTETFRFIKVLFWLRKHYEGFHNAVPQVVMSDVGVLGFLIGDTLILATNQVEASQTRIVWGNKTLGCRMVELCDISLSSERGKVTGCKQFARSRPTQVELNGHPQILVPRRVVEKLLAARSEAGDGGSPPIDELHPLDLRVQSRTSISDPPELRIEPVKRISVVKPDPGVFTYAPAVQRLLEASQMPNRLDIWDPPLVMPTSTVLHTKLSNACIALEREGWESMVIVRRPEGSYRSCRNDWDCDASNWATRNTAAAPRQTVTHKKQILDIFLGMQGHYHHLVEQLPRIVRYLPKIKAGLLDVFLGFESVQIELLLRRMGVPKTSLLRSTVANKTLFCSDHVLRVASGGESVQDGNNAEALRNLRESIHLSPPDNNNRSIVWLSRGTDTRSISNEADVIRDLQELRYPVQVIYPSSDNVEATMRALQNAILVIGPHGANLANILFAPHDAKLLEIMPQTEVSFVNYHYRSLAGALGFDYAYVQQKVYAYNHDVAKTRPDKMIPRFHVDSKSVKAMAASMLKDAIPPSAAFGITFRPHPVYSYGTLVPVVIIVAFLWICSLYVFSGVCVRLFTKKEGVAPLEHTPRHQAEVTLKKGPRFMTSIAQGTVENERSQANKELSEQDEDEDIKYATAISLAMKGTNSGKYAAGNEDDDSEDNDLEAAIA